MRIKVRKVTRTNDEITNREFNNRNFDRKMDKDNKWSECRHGRRTWLRLQHGMIHGSPVVAW